MRGLFVSPEHQRKETLRTHRAYKLAAYTLISWMGLQIPLTIEMLSEKKTAAEIRRKLEIADSQRTRLLLKSEPLRDVLTKVQAAQSWIPNSINKLGASEILSYLERSISDAICLTEITIKNKAQQFQEPDRFEVEIRGYGRNREPEAWMRSLEEVFPSWTISRLHAGKAPSTDSSEGLGSFSLLLQQPTNL